MSPADTPLWLMATAAGWTLTLFFARRLSQGGRRLRACERATPTPIGKAREGLVRLEGTALPADAVAPAPFSGAPALAHETRVVSWQPMYPSQTRNLAAARAFYVEDASGRALVRVDEAAQLELVAREEDAPILTVAQIEELGRHLRVHPAAQHGYTQRRLSPGDRVTVFGVGAWEPVGSGGAGGSYREPPRQLTVRPVDGKVLVIVRG